ncbi:MAG: pyridoxamine 5'-phosphate oxidase [Armatimonadetes bacterium]|nr:pyridoxamine 5'-phosphate oxidase [Armatimonadota bacterium]
MRSDYGNSELNIEDIPDEPWRLLADWIAAARVLGHPEPTAMALATCGADHTPSCRMVLARDVSSQGVTFFTNYESRKGVQISENPVVAATFWWPEFHRQVRIEGSIVKVSDEESDQYWESRPVESRAASASSPQSRPIQSRDTLEELINQMVENGVVSRPGHWGGYRIVPNMFEFWQGRTARIHDRFELRLESGAWKRQRLAP